METHNKRPRETDRQIEWKHIVIDPERQTDRETDRERQTDRQTDRWNGNT